MGDVISLHQEPDAVEEARNHLLNLCDVIRGIRVADENSLTLRDIAEENVGLALDILQDYLADQQGKPKKGGF
ncbi:hypothetical protein AAGQ96_12950 [Pantoea sp. MBD-2R]|uniref:hypothetical protein n=1 Tax=Pantoea sp. MBD-2R TaxID=3141540 RepID=UPI0031835C58